MNEIWYLFFFMVFVSGLYTITKEIVFPIADMILYAAGYTLFNIWRIDFHKVKNHKYGVLKYIIGCFFDGVNIWASTPGTTNDVCSGNLHWKPYFHYWKE